MKPAFVIKIFILTFMLLGVLWAIRSMKAENVERAFDALGLQSGGAGSPGLQAAGRSLEPGEERFNLCPTRVRGIDFNGKRQIEESKDALKVTWMAVDPRLREISTLDIEKWLTHHCQVVIRLIQDPEVASSGPDHPSLDFQYVDGTKLKFSRVGERIFKTDKMSFESADFAAALVELQQLAQFQPASGL